MKIVMTGVALAAALTCSALAQQPVKVELNDAEGRSVGSLILTPTASGVRIALDLKDIPPGEHALHVHVTPKCEGPKFASAGEHFNPANKRHGLKNPDGPHAGDMNNFTVGENGSAKATISAPGITLGDGANSLFANGGTSILVHARADDMVTDPAGNAGDPIACGVIAKR